MGQNKEFIQSFRSAADAFLANHPSLKYSWRDDPRKGSLMLSIMRESEAGFDVGVSCETYGLYPLAGDWHGSPWDAKTETHSESSQITYCVDWIRRALCPKTRLRVKTSSGSPFRWGFEYCECGQWKLEEEMGLLLFNYFGSRKEFILQNQHLPPLEELNPEQELDNA